MVLQFRAAVKTQPFSGKFAKPLSLFVLSFSRPNPLHVVSDRHITMPNSAIIARWFCGILTLTLSTVILYRPRTDRFSKATIYWLLALLGLLVALVPISRRLSHSNLGHYYIGAKYRIPYFDFYRAITAGRQQPQVGYRDLRQPHRFVRRDPLEQRYYALRLLNDAQIPIPDNAATTDLFGLCATAGLFRAEAQTILSQYFDERKAEAFSRDLQQVRVDTDDNGFNGSPFYVLVRQIDPTIHRPFGPLVGWINLIWQVGALLVSIHLLGRALEWDEETRALTAAVFLCSWDYNGWALNGLSFGGWLLPFGMSLYALSRHRPILAGLGIAWAGALKLFPWIALFPLGLLWLRAMRHARIPMGNAALATAIARKTLLIMLATVALTLGLATLSGYATDMAWSEFFQKILGQFQRSVFSVNTVSLAQILLALDVHTAHSSVIPILLYALTTFLLIGTPSLDGTQRAMPRIVLLLFALLGWVLGNWFNYYAVLSLFLLADLRQDQPRAAAGFLAFLGLATLLPDYDRCYLENLRILGIAKALPFLALPAWALGLHLSKAIHSPDARMERSSIKAKTVGLLYLVGLVLLMLLICVSVYRHHTARSAVHMAEAYQNRGYRNEAIASLRVAARHDPSNPLVALRLAEILDDAGRVEEARTWYTRVIQRNAEEARAWMNLGLLAAREKKTHDALRLLARAVQVAPHDAIGRYNYAVALKSAGMVPQARTEAQWAVWLRPDFVEARRLLAELPMPEATTPEPPNTASSKS